MSSSQQAAEAPTPTPSPPLYPLPPPPMHFYTPFSVIFPWMNVEAPATSNTAWKKWITRAVAFFICGLIIAILVSLFVIPHRQLQKTEEPELKSEFHLPTFGVDNATTKIFSFSSLSSDLKLAISYALTTNAVKKALPLVLHDMYTMVTFHTMRQIVVLPDLPLPTTVTLMPGKSVSWMVSHDHQVLLNEEEASIMTTQVNQGIVNFDIIVGGNGTTLPPPGVMPKESNFELTCPVTIHLLDQVTTSQPCSLEWVV